MTIQELVALMTRQPTQPVAMAPPDDGFNAARPWDSVALQSPQTATPAPQASPQPYTYATPDPFAQAQALEQRQGAVSKLTSPATPVLAIPADVLMALLAAPKKGK